MQNFFTAANPYGSTTLERIKAFEKQIGLILPDEYREYLLSYNAAMPINTVVHVSDKEGETTLNTMYGEFMKGDVAEQLRLSETFLDDISTKDTGLLAFADDSFGNQFCLYLKPKSFLHLNHYGQVFFFDHKSSNPQSLSSLIKVSNSFLGFIEKLISNDDYDEKMKQDYPEIYERMKALKK